MGGAWSWSSSGDAKLAAKQTSPESYVLVPPVISYDRNEPDRYAQSSFDWLYHKRQLDMLFTDALAPGVKFDAKLVPSSDEQLSSTAVLALPHVTWPSLWHRSAGDTNAWTPRCALRIRSQVDGLSRHTFASLCYSQLKDQPGPWLSVCRAQGTGLGGYLHVPLQDRLKTAVIGIRYGSPDLSVGLEGDAICKSVDAMWAVKRIQMRSINKRLLVGVQAGPPDSSLCVAVGLEGGSTLQMSIFQHLARVRRIYNLLEDADVVAITNYLDLGLRMRAPLDSDNRNAQFEAGAAWQVNSNLMMKALADMQRIALAVVLKSWWNPRFQASLMGGWEFASQVPCIGATLSVDNEGALQYERGRHTIHTGSLVRQKHIASASEWQAAKGKRLIVHGGEVENKAQDKVLLVSPPTPRESNSPIL